MKLHLSKLSGLNLFSGYGEGYVLINQKRYEHSLILLPDLMIDNWQAQTVEQLGIEHFECLFPYQPEIILLGTGANLCFPLHSLLTTFTKLGIGVEVMDTKATCRTYNILVEEGRRVAAALLI
ncbi:MAG: Mth938-like domain-containing protein [Nitrosomonas sp.]|nr:Mth938-like domain-containing protein [Nitrosomonas sp.]MDP1950539.1 Mth938-like domain-containing protein [Nitrosomonas sp.]